MPYEISSTQLATFEDTRIGLPHVVILGAGASRASFPSGDAKAQPLPLMADLIDMLDLRAPLVAAGFDPDQDFESLYSALDSTSPRPAVLSLIEQRVHDYFSRLELPDTCTLYDRLILSLREKDAIFTFNWDPFLVDAYERCAGIAPLPQIFHLHGNVRIRFCEACGLATGQRSSCTECGGALAVSPLLYPVQNKDYASSPFIKSQWDCLEDFLARAFVVTVFGYRAPTTDREAIRRIETAWKESEKASLIKRVEIIDIRDRETLARQWSHLAHYSHYDIRQSIDQSLFGHHPRRSCEALYQAGYHGRFVEPAPFVGDLDDLVSAASALANHE